MNWAQFQTHNLAPDKAFEILCNQLFQNWCNEQYSTKISSFRVVNGAGGDGGVESYAVLSDESIIGLQAKWFQTSMGDGQITQIKNSIKTAVKIRPAITDYIVCIPRDLASMTGRSDNTEDARWDKLVADMEKLYPTVKITLWNNARLVEELQKPNCSGIYRFWFETSEISNETVKYAFDKARSSWLDTKYVPALNTFGKIEKTISSFLGYAEQRATLSDVFTRINTYCKQYTTAADALLLVCSENDTELKDLVASTSERINSISKSCDVIQYWLENEALSEETIDDNAFNIDFDTLADQIYHAERACRLHFHISEVTKVLRKLSKIDCYELLQEVERCRSKRSIIFLGGPGTGKTHGVSAVTEKLLQENLHVPLLIRARNVPSSHTWKDIISDYLGISSEWNEDDLFQGLSSLAHRNIFTESSLKSPIVVTPKICVIIDGLDESAPHDRWVERIKETDAIVAKYPQIRFCFTSRSVPLPKPINYANAIRLGNGGDVPAYKLFDGYMKAYNISAENRGWLRMVLTTPLALKLFCELNQSKTVTCSNRAEVAMATLWRQKIAQIEKEYSNQTGSAVRNQYVHKAILHLSKLFMHNATCEMSCLLSELESNLTISNEKAEKLISCLENYGVISCYCEWGSGISPDTYYYYPGIQGYFDYVTATILLEQHAHPKDIDFAKYTALEKNTLHGLAVLAIQKHDYLITRNPTINAIVNDWDISELQFYALQHTNHINSQQFVNRGLEIMGSCSDGLMTMANKLILPLSKDQGHPLGVSLLDSFLSKFEKPAQRDMLWSIPGYLRDATDTRWYQSEVLMLQEEEYELSADDLYDGCPTVYAWALATVSNPLRTLYRDRLMVWARLAPDEFYKLFLKFSAVNDPQIKSDLFSILMCLVHDISRPDLLESASKWVMANILHPDQIDKNRDVSIRYYSIAIVKKAIYDGLITEENALPYLPPYRVQSYDIELNKDALQGTRMGGYKAIDYDLARYVLIDHFYSDFTSYQHREERQLDKLIEKISESQPAYKDISFEQLILSMAYAYVLQTGWTEEEFHNLTKDPSDEKIIGGVDISIIRTHSPATHGSMSKVMTVCEKYVWQARNEISGFLCDRLLFGDDALEITDYGLLDDFIVPSHEIAQINPDEIPEDRPWHTPEPEKVILNTEATCREDVVNSALNAPLIDWKKWILLDNFKSQYQVDSQALIALDMSSCFFGTAGVETNLFITAVLVKENLLLDFIEALGDACQKSAHIANPPDWYGGISASCYISPKEICCFPWKTRYECTNVESFPEFSPSCAVDSCCYNSPEFGDVYYYLPSEMVRKITGIVDTDGYLFTNSNHKVIAEYAIAGERWGARQTYLLLDRESLLNRLKQEGLSLVWLIKERRSHSGISLEKYGNFGVEHMRSFVGYFDNGSFLTREVRSEIMKNLPKDCLPFTL